MNESSELEEKQTVPQRSPIDNLNPSLKRTIGVCFALFRF
jgi:hypothetical protein